MLTMIDEANARTRAFGAWSIAVTEASWVMTVHGAKGHTRLTVKYYSILALHMLGCTGRRHRIKYRWWTLYREGIVRKDDMLRDVTWEARGILSRRFAGF